jgi:nucleoid DNA-binding protein
MNKQELVDAIASATGISKKLSQSALEAIIIGIVNTVKKGEAVTLVGFGTFKTAERSARKGRNPRTGAQINIPATKAPKFVPGKDFKEAVK